MIKEKKRFCREAPHGFTLVELIITMAISGVIAISIYSAYISQQRTYLAQEQVAEMQQNLRAAVELITREIKMAGYDYTGGAGSAITYASSGQMSFTMDGNDDGDLCDSNEIIDFGFNSTDDSERDGIPVAGGVPLRRQTGDTKAYAPNCTESTGGGYQAIADNIQAVEFFYKLADGTTTSSPSTAQLSEIRSVQVSILAKAGQADQNYTDTATYCQASNLDPDTGLCVSPAPADVWGPYNDNFRRRLLISTIQCRNLGL